MEGYDPSYYTATANAAPECQTLTERVDADVCIIGAGYTGLSAALHLAQQGYRVCVVEAQKVGWGASGRNGGQVCPGHNKDHEELIDLVGKQDADALWQLSIDSVELVKQLVHQHNIDCDLKQGIAYVAARPSDVNAIHQSADYLQNKLNYSAIRQLSTEQVQAMLGTDKYFGGKLWTEAVHLHPLNYALGLARAAQKAGVQIYENSAVTHYIAGESCEVVTAQGRVRSRYILLACNGYLEKLEPKIAGKIMPIKSLMLATEPLSDEIIQCINPDDIAVADSKFSVNYFRMSGDKRLLWGGPETYTGRLPADIGAYAKGSMLERYPFLNDVKIDYGWAGQLAITMNRMPHFQRLNQQVFVAQGYSGHGIALATLGGKLMADAIASSSGGFDVFARIPAKTFPGGTLLRKPGMVAGMLYYALRDALRDTL